MIRITYCMTVILAITLSLYAQESQPKTIKWDTQDTAGKAVTVPLAGKATVLLFAMVSQNHSVHAMDYAQQVLVNYKTVQMVGIISGASAIADSPKLVEDAKWQWPMVIDPEYKTSGQMLVRVWPTTLVIDADGKMIAHIGGCPASYSKDLAAYLDFAAGKLNKAALDQRLTDHNVVASTQNDIAKRHLQLGQRLMARGDYEEARSELEKGLELQPSDVMLQLTMARVDLLTHHPQEALQAIDKIDPKQLPNWRINAVRGRAMVALGQWDKALDVLLAAVRLNPEPSEVHYALGLVYEHDKDFQKAAASFRLAFETGESGKQLGIPLH